MEFNSENYKSISKKMNKEDIQPWMNGYASTARTLTRGCWFFDFLHVCFKGLHDQPEAKLSSMATAAYNEALAPHHAWVLKKIAGVAMSAVNYRNVFEGNYCKE